MQSPREWTSPASRLPARGNAPDRPGRAHIGTTTTASTAPARLRHLSRGRWPRPLAELTLRAAAKRAATFNQKVRHKMARDRRPILTTIADKVAVREYVSARVGAEVLTQLHAVMGPGDALPWSSLPRQFVGKCAHGSGAVVIAIEGAQDPLPRDPGGVTWERFLVDPDQLEPASLHALCRRWLTLNYEYYPGRLPEWAYRDIPPRVLFEELLTDRAGRLPVDLKFFVFDGRCELIQLDYDRYTEHRRDLFDRAWRRLPVRLAFPNATTPADRPERLAELLEVAEDLGRGLDFVRVDLYELDGRIVFGELTNYPGAGEERFEPRSFDHWLGRRWVLPSQTDEAHARSDAARARDAQSSRRAASPAAPKDPPRPWERG